jgi:hypothetical protein
MLCIAGRSLCAGALLFLAASAVATDPLRIQNAYVSVLVDPLQGGAVTSIVYRKAISFPFIAGKGAGVAGAGALFVPLVEREGVAPERLAMRVTRRGVRDITLSGRAAGLSLTRRLHMAAEQSGFTIEDQIRNDSTQNVIVRLGATSLQQQESWRWAERSWIGNQSETIERHIPVKDGDHSHLEASTGSLFWRQIGQYGTGLLYRVQSLQTPAGVDQEVLPAAGNPVRFTWKTRTLSVPAQGNIVVKADVLVDEGGGAPDQQNAFSAVLARSDAALAGHSGEALTAFATVVSPEPRDLRVTVSADRELTHADLHLQPGKVARVPVLFTPSAKGDLPIRVAITEYGREIAVAASHTVIDGDAGNEIWKTYSSRMPEESYRGSWRTIGEELAQNAGHIGAPSSVQIATRSESGAAPDLSFYRKRFPYYTEMVTGAAKVAHATPERLVFEDRAAHGKEACMDIAFYGPDGPINAFSKERSSASYKGLGYIKVVPDQGYAFHTYMGVGINSEGLSVSSATLNEDPHTHAVAFTRLDEWKRSGRHLMPPGADRWMLLAMCRNVDEAVAMIQDRDAPMEFTGNMLLVDRTGNAARVESVGIDHQVFRSSGDKRGFFVAGNYPHENARGLFRIGSRPGWAANTMLREQFLRDFAEDRQGKLSLQDVISLMQTHEAGAMCQHLYDNPGVLYTSCSFIAVCRTSELWLSQGPPCRNQYVRHKLER